MSDNVTVSSSVLRGQSNLTNHQVSFGKTKKQYDGQNVYEVTKDIDDILKKGDKLYLDGRHKDHFEVFNKRGKVKDVLNPVGTSNSKKFNLASGRRLK